MSDARRPGIVLLVFLVFFVVSLVTNILGPVIPDIIRGFRLSLALAGVLPFAFFIAYGIMSIPAGMLIERRTERPVLIAAFAVVLAGSSLFVLVPRYPAAIASLFLNGLGIAAVQVALNPLLRAAGGAEHFAVFSVAAQLVFGAASFLSPLIYVGLVRRLEGPASGAAPWSWLAAATPAGKPWISLYVLFALLAAAVIALLARLRLPRIVRDADGEAGSWAVHRALLKNRTVLGFFAAIFAYVGFEQGTANWISQFLVTYHGRDPLTAGARTVSAFWGMMTAGCLLGLLALKLADSRKVLMAFSAGAAVFLGLALFGGPAVPGWAFPMVGFCASVMWSVIFSLALNSVERHHGVVSGILCTGVAGGAIVPLLIGGLGDLAGLRVAMLVLFGALAYIFGVGLWARPLVANATLGARRRRLAAARREEP